MDDKSTRWLQRLATYKKALARLTEVVEMRQAKTLTPLELDGKDIYNKTTSCTSIS